MKTKILSTFRLYTLRIMAGIILVVVVFSGAVAYAAGETDVAANYLAQQGIYKGDGNGNLYLDKGLTRAELAVILTRLDFADDPDEWTDWGEARFSNPEHRYNTFTDVPNWALPYIEYCYQRSLMKGVAATRFDPQGDVNAKMACTVMLRFCGVSDTDWNYDTSVKKAQSIGIAPTDGMNGDVILRGTMAVLIYRSIMYAENGTLPSEPTEDVPAPSQPLPPTSNAETVMTIDEMKSEIVRLTNIERVKAGLPELVVLPELMDCAQVKAQDFIDNNYFGHNSPVYGTVHEMIKARVPGAKTGGENILMGTPYDTPQVAVEAWMESSGHRANILNPRYTHVGVGLIIDTIEFSNTPRFYWVQEFAVL